MQSTIVRGGPPLFSAGLSKIPVPKSLSASPHPRGTAPRAITAAPNSITLNHFQTPSTPRSPGPIASDIAKDRLGKLVATSEQSPQIKTLTGRVILGTMLGTTTSKDPLPNISERSPDDSTPTASGSIPALEADSDGLARASKEKNFVLVGGITSHFVSHKLKLPRLDKVDQESAFARLKNSQWDGKFSKVFISRDGTCFYGEPFPGKYSKQNYPLIVSRDGVWIEHDPLRSPVVLGSSHGEGGSRGPVVQEGRTIDLMEQTEYQETSYTGRKPGEMNILRFSNEEIAARGATGRADWWSKINKPFIEESVQEQREIVIISRINDLVTRRGAELTAFGSEVGAMGNENSAFHAPSGRVVYPEEIRHLLRQGATLEKTDQGILKIDTSTIPSKTEIS